MQRPMSHSRLPISPHMYLDLGKRDEAIAASNSSISEVRTPAPILCSETTHLLIEITKHLSRITSMQPLSIPRIT